MPLFVCEKCGCVENTALGKYWAEKERLCSECAFGKWHGRFPKEKFDSQNWYVKKDSTGFIELNDK